MHRIVTTMCLTAVLVVFQLLSPPVPLETAHAREGSSVLVEATRLLNRSVYFAERDRAGEINEMYMDPMTGLVPFCMLSFHVFLDMVEKKYLVSIPWPYVSFDTRNQRFVIQEIKTEGGGEIDPLPYKPRAHRAISPFEAEAIFTHYELGNLLEEARNRSGTDQEAPVVDIIRLTNIPVYSQGTLMGRAEQYFMDLDTGMVRMVLVNRTRNGNLTGDFVLLPFPVLQFDPTSFQYRLTVSEARLSDAPQFSYPADTYYPIEQAEQVYRDFGLSSQLEW